MNLDLEQSAPLRRRGPRNESNDESVMSMIPPPPPGLPARHPLQLLKRTAIICGTLYAMHGKWYYLGDDDNDGSLKLNIFLSLQPLTVLHLKLIDQSNSTHTYRYQLIPQHYTQPRNQS